MNREGIRNQAREWLGDTARGQLWESDTLNTYADEAVREAVLRARLLVDSHSKVTQIPVVAGVASYTLDKSIIFARRVGFLDSTGQQERALFRTSYDVLDNEHEFPLRRLGNANWKLWRTPHPHYVVQDLEQRTLRLVGIPTGTGTLQLTVVRWPFKCEEMEDDDACPVIDEQYHLPLAHWVCYRAFLTKDDEQYDPKRSADHYALFEATFGPRPTVKEIRAMAHDRAGEVHQYLF